MRRLASLLATSLLLATLLPIPVALAGTPATMVFTQWATGTTQGVVFGTQPQVRVRDSESAGVAGVDVTLSMVANSGTGVLTCANSGLTVATDVNGYATFDGCSISLAGNYTLVADTADPLHAQDDAAVVIGSGSPTTITFTAHATGTRHDVAFGTQPAVHVVDEAGYAVSGASVLLEIKPLSGTGGAVLTCTDAANTVTTGVAGNATWSGCAIDLAGTGYYLQATAGSVTQADDSAFDIYSGTPVNVAFTQHATSVRHDTAFGTQPIVRVTDEGNQGVAAPVTLSIAPATGADGATLTCTTNPVTSDATGYAEFAGCRIDLAGSGYQLKATAGLVSATDASAFAIYSGLPVTTAFTSSPSTTTAGVAFGTQPVVHVTDEGGGSVEGASVSLSIKSGSGTLGAALACTSTTTVLTDASGDATFAGCKIDKAGTGYRLHAAVSGATASDTGTFDIGVGPAAIVTFGTQPAGAAANGTLTAQPVVHVTDDQGNPVSGASVGLAISPATGTPTAILACSSSTTVVTDASGDATFSGCAIDLAGTGYQLHATANSVTATSTAFNVSSGVATSLSFTTQPSGGTAGAAFGTQPVVHATDEAGHPAVGASVTLAISSGTGDPDASFGCTSTTVATDGSGDATFSGCTINLVAADYQLHATAGGATPADSSAFAVTPDVAVSLAITGFPLAPTAGVAASFTVTAKDQFGNIATSYAGTVAFSSTDGSASLPGNYTFLAGDNGFHTFTSGATLFTAGAQSVTATDTVTGSITGTRAGITVAPAAASTLVVSGFADPATAGTAHSFSVTAQDAFGNTATGYTGTVHVTSSDTNPSVALPADYTFLPGDNGTHSLSATLVTAGEQSITATDTLTGSITGSQTAITVNAAAASTLVVSAFPGTTTAGVAHDLTVTAEDAYGNTVTGYAGTVAFTSSDPAAVVPGNYTFIPGDSGVHTFASGATLKTAGTRSITATDTVSGTVTGTLGSITVNAAAASALVVAGFPSPAAAGDPGTFTVTAQDAFGNTATGYAGTIHLTSSDTDLSVVLPGDYTFVPGTDHGVHTFTNGATLITAGTQSITATDAGNGTITGSQTGILVQSASSAFSLVVAGFTDPTTAGVEHTFTVTAKDAFGNTATGYTGTVHFTSSDTGTGVALPADYTFLSGDNGTATFAATLVTAGDQSITATDGSLTSQPMTVTVAPAAAASLVLDAPATATAGTAFDVTVTAKDAFGNTATSYAGTVHFATSDVHAAAAVPADYTFLSGDNGTHAFSAATTLATAGAQTITASDGTFTSTPASVDVAAAAASALVFTAQPGGGTGGTAWTTQPVVAVRDAYGNTVTSSSASITLAIGTNPGSGALACTANPKAAASGVAAFAGCQIDKAGTGYTLTASASGLTGATSSAFNVTVGSAAKVAFTAQPGGGTGGTAWTTQPVVAVQDAGGNTVSSSSASITLAIGTNPGSGALTCTANPKAAASGVAAFAGCRIDKAGTGYTLTASASGLTGATSSSFNVTVGTVSRLAFTTGPSAVAAGSAISPAVVVTAQDAGGNTVTSYTSSITISSATSAFTTSTLTVAATAGVSTFSALRPTTAGGANIIAASDGTRTITSSAFSVTAGPAAKVAVTRQPSTTTTAGSAFAIQPQVTVQDAFGNTVTSSSASVTVALTTPGSATLAGAAPVNAASGVATFAGLSVDKAGTYTLTASSGGLTDAVSSSFAITAGPAATLAVVSGSGQSAAAGAAFGAPLVASVADQYGNPVAGVQVAFAAPASGARAVVAGSPATTASNGRATVTATAGTVAGAYSVTASSAGLTSVGFSLTNTAGLAAKLAIARQPSSTATVGLPLAVQPQVTVQDANGNTVTSSSASVTLAVTGGATTIACTANPVAAVAGVATFAGCALAGGGLYTLTASSGALTTATTTSITVAKLAQAITITSTKPVRAIATGTYTPKATASSGLPVAITLSAGAGTVCSIASGIVRFLAPGTCTVAYAQAGNLAYSAAPGKTESILVNTPPTCSSPTVSMVANLPKSGGPLCTDANTDPMTFKLATAPAHGAVTLGADGSWTYTPVSTYAGADSFAVTANDGYATSAPGTVKLAITNVAVQANADVVSVQPILPSAIDVLANDKANDVGQPLAITAVTQPAHGRVTISAGKVVYDPTACYASATGTFDYFTYTVSDGPTSATTAVAVTVVRPGGRVTAPAAATLPITPVVEIQSAGILTGGTLGTTAPARVSWCSVTASGSTLKSYRVRQSSDGGATYTTISSTSTATSVDRALNFTSTYRWLILATDSAGRVSAAALSPTAKVAKYDDKSTSITYAGSWATTSSSNYSSGTEHYSSSTSASATIQVTGVRQIAIVSSMASTRGSFKIYVDGTLVTTASEKATTAVYRRVVVVRTLTSGAHTVVLKPATTTRIDIDAILTLQ